jgi:two-component system OmpR family response regulator
VDDEAPIRELLSLYFRRNGFDVTTATNRAEGMAAAEQKYDLVILDVDLAGENGLELLTLFKAKRPKLPVIIFTILTDKEIFEQAMANGADGLMRKTDSLSELLAEVRRHLPPA